MLDCCVDIITHRTVTHQQKLTVKLGVQSWYS